MTTAASTDNPYRRLYDQVFHSLNPEQRTAAEQIEGPVLVIAGPGAGKTHILAARIGQILLKTDAQPHNILCLTFTDAGAAAMREKLMQLIGPEGRRVSVFTYHSFCNSVIQDHLTLFGRQDLEPVGKLERIEIIRSVIDRLPALHILKKGRNAGDDLYHYETQLRDLFSLMKRENWSAEHIHDKIGEYLLGLGESERYKYQKQTGDREKGSVKKETLAEEVRKMETLRAASALFPEYQRELQKMKRYDFEDMILWVVQAFQKFPFLLRRYQEQYLYFLIDEYQDTNGAQNQLIDLLSNFWNKPNLFIVGDDDQAIYEFQGARLESLSAFYEKYKTDLTAVVLQGNYRSTQAILNWAGSLIRQNEKRIIHYLKEKNFEKKLLAKNAALSEVLTIPVVAEYKNRLQEDADITRQIEDWKSKDVALKNIAIIYAQHRQAENIIRLFERKGIAYNTKRAVNILDVPLVQNLLAIWQYVQAEYAQPLSGEHLLFSLLHIDFFEIPLADADALAVGLALANARGEGRKLTWRETLRRMSESAENKSQSADFIGPEAVSAAGRKALKICADFLEILIGDLQNLPLQTILEKTVNLSGALNLVLKHPDKIWLLETLNALNDYTLGETAKTPRLTLQKFLQGLDALDANGVRIEVQKNIQAADGVFLTSAHSSKGLEFERVFIIDAVEDYWEKSRGGRTRFKLPETLTFTDEEDQTEARRRLFYVALTRAKEYLQISYSRASKKGEKLTPSMFIGEAMAGAGVPVEIREVSDSILIESETLLLSAAIPPSVEALEQTVADALLKNFILTISSLNAYLKCPLQFYYEYVLQIPSTPSEFFGYGQAVHYALRRLFEDMLGSAAKNFPPVQEFIRYFQREMHRNESAFTPAEYRRAMETGRNALTELYKTYAPVWEKNVVVERFISRVELDGVPIQGAIDKIEFKEDGSGRVVEYKTGKHKPEYVAKPSLKNPYGGPFRRQLIFYKFLYEQSRSAATVINAGVIFYTDPDRLRQFTHKEILIDPKDARVFRALVKETYQKIMSRDFYTGCNLPDCEWCGFVKRNIRRDSWRDKLREAMDDV